MGSVSPVSNGRDRSIDRPYEYTCMVCKESRKNTSDIERRRARSHQSIRQVGHAARCPSLTLLTFLPLSSLLFSLPALRSVTLSCVERERKKEREKERKQESREGWAWFQVCRERRWPWLCV